MTFLRPCAANRFTLVDAASELLRSYDAGPVRCYPIITWINYVTKDDEECSTPVGVELAQIQNLLFS
jgi:hypothetical protein